MIVNYEESSDESVKDENGDGKCDKDNSFENQTVTDNIKKRFLRLKEKRKLIQSSSHEEEFQVTSKETKFQGDKNIKKGENKKSNVTPATENLIQYREYSYKLLDDYQPHTVQSSKLEAEIDEAIKNKEFEKAERLNARLIEENLSEEIRGAEEAKKYLENKELLENKKRRRKKLKWSMNHKQRWETKGNM